MSKEANEFFKKYKDGLLGGINTSSLCRVVAFDHQTMKVDVVTLPDGDLIQNVPVQAPQTGDFIIRVPYKPGNVGVIVFSKNQIDDVMMGGIGETSAREFSIDDAIFIGGINLFNDVMGADHGEDLIISKKDYSAKIVLTKDGDILLQPAAGKKLIIDSPGGVDIKGGDVIITGGTITANGEDLTTDLT
ncbi:Gp138 family membrane-puncturing spike protein [Solibacillus sp. FSL W8-0474]|uniref:Gp138 family membrane-puncturing spike protein n=1 Tax=Solibacillus sp. FSL W8-0474 TaxID=2975336 RepID=UPI0030FACF1D